ncbi:MAG: 16S rRNA (cytidine(1402)-2'-O)-methyltransferase, partial [Clostridia bacterium]|nr:16S rRNA (cytidine(1402)-2'-O)-methyltransferase [Clostridia bacterium]
MSGKLYIVGTPIGNLEDFSPRGRRILSEVDFIAAEDTRVTVKLLNHLGISKPMVAYFEHNKKERGNVVIDRLLSGETCALVTDAGMPAISDPGEDLIRECHERDIEVESVPGPTAFATAMALSGMPSGRFCFEGFLSVNKPSRKKHLEEIKNEKRTLIFYEAPHKLIKTLDDMYAAFGERKIAIVREITKIHETVMRTSFSEAIEFYKTQEPRGEYVLIIEGAKEETVSYTLEEAI